MDRARILERAFELSSSGECKTMQDLERRLKREGFTSVLVHLEGRSLRKQLADRIKQAAARAAG